jgi:hypothetical protein
VPVLVRTVRLYDPNGTISVRNATVKLYSDASGTTQVGQADSGQVADGGTNVGFADVRSRVVRVEFRDVAGTQAGLQEIEVIARGAAGSTGPPPAAPSGLHIK